MCSHHPDSQGACVCLWVWCPQQRTSPNTALKSQPSKQGNFPKSNPICSIWTYLLTLHFLRNYYRGWGLGVLQAPKAWEPQVPSTFWPCLPSWDLPSPGGRGLVWKHQLGADTPAWCTSLGIEVSFMLLRHFFETPITWYLNCFWDSFPLCFQSQPWHVCKHQFIFLE